MRLPNKSERSPMRSTSQIAISLYFPHALTCSLRCVHRQIYNADRGLGFPQQFKIIPFVSQDGTVQWPTAWGLPPLLDTRAVNNLKDSQLDQYLDGYGIKHVGLDRELKLTKLGEYIGYIPADSSTSHGMTFFFMLAMGCLLYFYFPQLFV
ncbi:hypothetical protein EDD16DRAFT_1642155 [Pisolithus croceorrhizus]|nr:hypothetical protein EDD16DRAFT_1642155 [Pisolithus croceorrhizus]